MGLAHGCFGTTVLWKGLMGMDRRYRRCRDDRTSGHCIIPHEMDGELHAIEEALVADVCRQQGWLGRYFIPSPPIKDVDRLTIGVTSIG